MSMTGPMIASPDSVLRTDNLRASTRAFHEHVEHHEMVRIMLNEECDPTTYAVYLWNLGRIYQALEGAARKLGLIGEDIFRAEKIRNDFDELWHVRGNLNMQDAQSLPVFPSTRAHVARILEIAQDETLLMAHVYVRHLGDLQGGQLLKTKIPGSATFYSFEDRPAAIRDIHAKLSDEMHDEAVRVFQFAHQLFDDLLRFRNSHVVE